MLKLIDLVTVLNGNAVTFVATVSTSPNTGPPTAQVGAMAMWMLAGATVGRPFAVSLTDETPATPVLGSVAVVMPTEVAPAIPGTTAAAAASAADTPRRRRARRATSTPSVMSDSV